MSKILLISRCAWTLYNFRRGLMSQLVKDGHNTLGAGAGGDGFEPKIEALGVPFTSIPVDKRGINPRADLRLFWRLYRLYRSERPDVVHHFTIKPVIYGSIAARLAGVPRIVNTVTGLGYVFTENRSPWLRRVVEMQYRIALRCAHFTFFQNQDDLDSFRIAGLVSSGRSDLLPGSGVDTNYFTPSGGEHPQRNGHDSVFLMCGRLLRDKGVYEFVEAAREVKARFPSTRFLLLGGRDERNPTVVDEKDLKKWQADGVVEWLGQVEDVRGPLADADVVVLPSYREGTPRSLLEAAAMAKPIITTDAVGCREVVDDRVNGLLVPVKDSAALAMAMCKMVIDPELRKKMGFAGRAKVVREFDESLVLHKTLAVYGSHRS